MFFPMPFLFPWIWKICSEYGGFMLFCFLLFVLSRSSDFSLFIPLEVIILVCVYCIVSFFWWMLIAQQTCQIIFTGRHRGIQWDNLCLRTNWKWQVFHHAGCVWANISERRHPSGLRTYFWEHSGNVVKLYPNSCCEIRNSSQKPKRHEAFPGKSSLWKH